MEQERRQSERSHHTIAGAVIVFSVSCTANSFVHPVADRPGVYSMPGCWLWVNLLVMGPTEQKVASEQFNNCERHSTSFDLLRWISSPLAHRKAIQGSPQIQ
jgi:hypothetical protein